MFRVHRAAVVVTDSKINVDAFKKGELHCRQSANADLWCELFRELREKGKTLELQWSKGHADSLEVFLQYQVSPRNLVGNLCADQLAAYGAELAQVSVQDAMNFKWHQALVKRIQVRAIVILSTVLQKIRTHAKREGSEDQKATG